MKKKKKKADSYRKPKIVTVEADPELAKTYKPVPF